MPDFLGAFFIQTDGTVLFAFCQGGLGEFKGGLKVEEGVGARQPLQFRALS